MLIISFDLDEDWRIFSILRNRWIKNQILIHSFLLFCDEKEVEVDYTLEALNIINLRLNFTH